MTYKDFAMWLQGILELSPDGLDAAKVAYILSKIGTLTFPGEPAKIVTQNPPATLFRC